MPNDWRPSQDRHAGSKLSTSRGCTIFIVGEFGVVFMTIPTGLEILVPAISASQTRVNALMEPVPFQTRESGTVPGQARDKDARPD
jgi:hypothetical protein